MKLLETIFLGLTILVPIFFIFIGFKKHKRFKRSKRFRYILIETIFLSFIFNGVIFSGLKFFNKKIEIASSSLIDTNNKPINSLEEPNKKTELPKGNEEIPISNEPSSTNEIDKKPDHIIEERNGATYIDGIIIVNKSYPLSKNYVPVGTHKEINSANCQECLIEEVYQAYSKMRKDASDLGMTLWIASGYRSYEYQTGLYNSYVSKHGQDLADTYSARAGYSEHQTGWCFDLNTVNDAFANTKEGQWINENSYKYGFIIRYPKEKETETGYKYEPWHLRYVGADLASKLYNNGNWITLEEHFGITSKYE